MGPERGSQLFIGGVVEGQKDDKHRLKNDDEDVADIGCKRELLHSPFNVEPRCSTFAMMKKKEKPRCELIQPFAVHRPVERRRVAALAVVNRPDAVWLKKM